MNQTHPPLAPALCALLLLLALAGCDRTDNSTAERAARRAADTTATMGASAAAELEDAGLKARAVTEKAVAAAGDAAAGIAGRLAVDDVLIAAKVSTGLAADKDLSALKIRVASHAGVVTLRGPAPSAAAKARAEEIARNVQGVTSVDNQLAVQAG